MAAKIIDGKAVAASIKESLALQVPALEAEYGRKPCIAVIIVGSNPASQTYVKSKVTVASKLGMESRLLALEESASEAELLELVGKLNADSDVDGILIQLPLPKQINEDKVLNAINAEKDVDGFHPVNVARLWLGEKSLLPCTPKGIIRLIESSGIEIAGKIAVVVGRSNIVGKPVAKLLLDRNATVIMAHSRTADLKAMTLQADILVVAVGRPGMVTGDMVKPGAVVIDVGINRTADGKLCGDVDFQSASLVAGAITPVPGGVGPMTIAMLMENTIECFINRNKNA